MKLSFHAIVTFSLLLGAARPIAWAQSPFQFREAAFLERRLQDIGKDYSVDHPMQVFHTGPSPMYQTTIDSRDLATYRDYRKMPSVLASIDDLRRQGAIQVAEARYIEFVELIRKAQGPDSSDQSLVLDHLGEFYLEERDFEQAYRTFSEALRVRRIALEKARNDPNDSRRWDPQFKPGRLHLADLLTRLGQMDLAREDLAGAESKLKEAVEINNSPGNLHYINRLDSAYFLSLLLEKQEKWPEAKQVWKLAIESRAVIGEEPYWEAMKEYAAFFARHGDFHSAGQIASQVIAGTSGKPIKVAAPLPYWIDSRARTDRLQFLRGEPSGRALYYDGESLHAMAEILAIDRWITGGPEVASPLVRNPIDTSNQFLLERGSDADLLRLHSWFEKKIFLQMSILLDGNPTPERIAKAYAMLSPVKGRYLATLSALSRQMDEAILNPGISGSQIHFPQVLADARERYTSAFLSTALHDPNASLELVKRAASDERLIREAVGALCAPRRCTQDNLSYRLAPGSARLDFVLWSRTDKKRPNTGLSEYGVFVLREGRPTEYIRLGSAADVDELVEAMELEVDSFFQNHDDRSAELQGALQKLYSSILAPLEGFLQGVDQLLVIPDGRLSLVPLGALVDRQGHYFLERHNVIYLTSGISLPKGTSTSAPVVMANPDFDLVLPGSKDLPERSNPHFKLLPAAEREAALIAKELNLPPNRVFVGKGAREELLHAIRSPTILHLATHSDPFLQASLPAEQAPKYDLFEFPSLVSAQDPFLHSVIAFAGANHPQAGPEDGLLTGLEVASLHLAGTKLVVLSSCQSANGKLVDGQGVPGLRAAFNAAGARSLLMNLWPVNDEASLQFMQFFYSHINLGYSEAMRQAQLYMLKETNYKSAFFWAGYTYSDNDALIPEEHLPGQSTAVLKPGLSSTPMAVAPRCYKVTGHVTEKNELRYIVRINVNRVVQTLTPVSAAYSLGLPENDISVTREAGGKPIPFDVPSDEPGAGVFILQKAGPQAGMIIQLGSPFFQIFLQGPGSLLPTLDLPGTLPTLPSYSMANANSLDGPITIDSLGNCDDERHNRSNTASNDTVTAHKPAPLDTNPSKAGPQGKLPKSAAADASTSSGRPSAVDIPTFEKLQLKPRCFELEGIVNKYPGVSVRLTARILLSRARTMQTSDNDSIAYDLRFPGNEVTITSQVNGKPAKGGVTSDDIDTLMLIMNRDSKRSSFELLIGKTKPATYIALQGPPSLFQTLDVPEALPLPSSFTEAKLVLQDIPANIDTIRSCKPETAQSEADATLGMAPNASPAKDSGGGKSSTAGARPTGPKTTGSNPLSSTEVLIAPRCFQLSGISSTFSGLTTRFTARIVLGGVVHQLLRGDQIAVYDIQQPGNEVAIISDINGTRSSGGMYASKGDGTVLTIQKSNEGSRLSVRIAGSDRDWITLKGPADLFPALDIPEVLPVLSMYSEASVLGNKVDRIGFCGAESLQQFNNGVIRSTVPDAAATADKPSNKEEKPEPAANVPGARMDTAVTPADSNVVLARQVLASALQGDAKSIFQHVAPEADKTHITAMVSFLSNSVKGRSHCSSQSETVEVHKVLWADRHGGVVPAYVAIGDCETARPRLLLFIDQKGLITRTGTGGFVSKSFPQQIEQRAQDLAELLLRRDFKAFSENFTPKQLTQLEDLPAILDSVVQNLGTFQRIVASQKYPYADIVVVTGLFERGTVNVEIYFDTALRVSNWHVQTADKPRYFWQEFKDVPR